ncbi:type II toxin-antitoxin system death-on-curing family toxin [Dokdonia sinensis]|uniref:Type II toxin-antitoxin system death-on-curing family toxin n=1 Tax=Dokdonia sinensis TaxID=2479847 RepID=A0A3M0FUB6_9FLAO|nr:type II toxin-antitoxin system death-on-curing family toxin [Dokdonia sinensis]RMB56108.1 type II toxin-antitoxin system death-on-curing family toxin [Dokdonia sinensis]
MITPKLIKELNELIFSHSGGSAGVRDEQGLLSAINRPYQTFDGRDLYPTIIDKAAAIFQSIIINHPFIDGNKRMAYALMRYLLYQGHFELNATEEEKYQFVIKASKGEFEYDDIKTWILKYLKA